MPKLTSSPSLLRPVGGSSHHWNQSAADDVGNARQAGGHQAVAVRAGLLVGHLGGESDGIKVTAVAIQGMEGIFADDDGLSGPLVHHAEHVRIEPGVADVIIERLGIGVIARGGDNLLGREALEAHAEDQVVGVIPPNQAGRHAEIVPGEVGKPGGAEAVVGVGLLAGNADQLSSSDQLVSLVFQAILNSSSCGQTKWIVWMTWRRLGSVVGQIVEICAGAGEAVAPVQFVVEEVAEEIGIVSEGGDLGLDGLLGHQRPLRGIEPLGRVGDPGPEIEILAHGNIERMECRIAPGARVP